MAEDQVRTKPGSPLDRAPPPPKIANTAAYGLSAGLGIATLHWLMKGYHPGSPWQYSPPDDALVEMWIVTILPTIHLIGRIVNHHLQKLAGEDE